MNPLCTDDGNLDGFLKIIEIHYLYEKLFKHALWSTSFFFPKSHQVDYEKV